VLFVGRNIINLTKNFMQEFDLAKSLNENLGASIRYKVWKSAEAIDDFLGNSVEMSQWAEKYELKKHLQYLDEIEFQTVNYFEIELEIAFKSLLIDKNRKIDCIDICMLQLGSGVQNCVVEGGFLKLKLLLLEGGIPDLSEVLSHLVENALQLPSFKFLEEYLADKTLHFQNEQFVKIIDVLFKFCIHKTRKWLFEAIERLDKKGVFEEIPHNNPLLFYFGEANNLMFSVYIFQKK
jgi:hypothetical protein